MGGGEENPQRGEEKCHNRYWSESRTLTFCYELFYGTTDCRKKGGLQFNNENIEKSQRDKLCMDDDTDTFDHI